MTQKFLDEAGALSGGMKLANHMNQTRIEQAESAKGSAPARRKRTVLSGGMFNHNSRMYRR